MAYERQFIGVKILQKEPHVGPGAVSQRVSVKVSK